MAFQIDTAATIEPGLRKRMYKLRKKVFCDELGWDIPHCDEQEADIFDFNSSYYLNWIDDSSGALIGSVRLMSLTQDNLMTTVFKSTLAEDSRRKLARDGRVWEGSRLCVDNSLIDLEDRHGAFTILLYALFLSCRAMGVEKLLCNCNSIMYRRYRSLGFQVEHLGMTKEFRHGAVHCLGFELSEANLLALYALSDASSLDEVVPDGDGIRVARAFIGSTQAPVPGVTVPSVSAAFIPADPAIRVQMPA